MQRFKSCLEYIKVKEKLWISNCFKCNKNHKKYFNKGLVKRFTYTYKFCDGDKVVLNAKKKSLC